MKIVMAFGCIVCWDNISFLSFYNRVPELIFFNVNLEFRYFYILMLIDVTILHLTIFLWILRVAIISFWVSYNYLTISMILLYWFIAFSRTIRTWCSNWWRLWRVRLRIRLGNRISLLYFQINILSLRLFFWIGTIPCLSLLCDWYLFCCTSFNRQCLARL